MTDGERDKRYFFVFLLCSLWWATLSASNCTFVDGPFAFVRGCDNYGIEWNSFMAPTGMFVVIAMPVTILYFILRTISVLFSSIRKLIIRNK